MYCRANIIFNQWKVTISQFLSFPSLLLQYITVRFLSFNWSTQMQPVIMHYSTLTAAPPHTILLQCPLHLHLLQHPLDRNLLLSRFFPLKIPPHLLVYTVQIQQKREERVPIVAVKHNHSPNTQIHMRTQESNNNSFCFWWVGVQTLEDPLFSTIDTVDNAGTDFD